MLNEYVVIIGDYDFQNYGVRYRDVFLVAAFKLLNNRVVKTIANYSGRTLQRFYLIDDLPSEVISKLSNVVKYQIKKVEDGQGFVLREDFACPCGCGSKFSHLYFVRIQNDEVKFDLCLSDLDTYAWSLFEHYPDLRDYVEFKIMYKYEESPIIENEMPISDQKFSIIEDRGD